MNIPKKIAPCDLDQADDAYRSHFEISENESLVKKLNTIPLKKFNKSEARLFGQGPYGPVVDNDLLPGMFF